MMPNLNVILLVFSINIVFTLSKPADETIVKPPPASHGVRVLPPGKFKCLLIYLIYMQIYRLTQKFVHLIM